MALIVRGLTPPFSAPLMRHIDRAASLSAGSSPLSLTTSSSSSLRAAEEEKQREREREREIRLIMIIHNNNSNNYVTEWKIICISAIEIINIKGNTEYCYQLDCLQCDSLVKKMKSTTVFFFYSYLIH